MSKKYLKENLMSSKYLKQVSICVKARGRSLYFELFLEFQQGYKLLPTINKLKF